MLTAANHLKQHPKHLVRVGCDILYRILNNGGKKVMNQRLMLSKHKVHEMFKLNKKL